jgi:hypothetical protein
MSKEKKVNNKKDLVNLKKEALKEEVTKKKSKESKVKEDKVKESKVKEDKVKESKVKEKKQIDNKKAFFIIGALILVIIFSIYFLFFYSPYKFNFNVEGVSYKSNFFTPLELNNKIKNSGEIFISPKVESDEDVIIATKVVTAWSQILLSKGIVPIQLIRVHENGALKECVTNDGNVLSVRQINAKECELIINNANNYSILFDFSKNEVIIGPKTLKINSNKALIYDYSFRVLENIFPDAKEIITKNNEILAGIN